MAADRTLIIGAGPAGLAAARALTEQGLPYDHVERHSDVGGLWDIENPGTPMYESAHFISSRTLSGFPAYQLGGTWVQDGVTKMVAQKTTVIPGSDGWYVLQLNADGLESQLDIVGPATDAIDEQTTITP